MRFTSGKGRLGVGPGLDPLPDRFVRVGRDDDPVPVEVEKVDLTVGVMALEGGRVGFLVEVPGRDPAVCSGDRTGSEQCCGAGGEIGQAAVPVGQVPDNLCLVVLVQDLRGVSLAGLLHTGVGDTSGYVGHTSEGIRYNNCLDDRVEGRRVLNRVCQIAEGGLGGSSILEVCHFLSSPFFFFPVSGAPLTHTCGPYGVLRVSRGLQSGLLLWPVWGLGAFGVQKEENNDEIGSRTTKLGFFTQVKFDLFYFHLFPN